MTSTLSTRRRFLAGLCAIIAAPAIVRVSSLMPVKVMEPFRFTEAVNFLSCDRVIRLEDILRTMKVMEQRQMPGPYIGIAHPKIMGLA